MDAHAVLNRLSELGVSARVEGDKVLLQPGSKVPSELKDAVREHKPEIIAVLTRFNQDTEAFLTRLRRGHEWLLKQHELWQSGDSNAADDVAFSKAWNDWWELDSRLRAEHGLTGCVYGPAGKCPEGFPCQGCADVSGPGVVAQLELTAAVSDA